MWTEIGLVARALAMHAAATQVGAGEPRTPGDANVFGTAVAQVRIVPAAAFQPARSGMAWQLEGGEPGPGQLHTTNGSAGTEYVATVDLPSGLRLTELRSYFIDTAASEDVSIQLWRTAGAAPAELLATASSTLAPGESTASDLSLDRLTDNSGNGQLFLRLTLPEPTTGSLRFREAMLVWKREIKDFKHPVCDPSFDDVPCTEADDVFNAIESIRAAGITVGCSSSPPLYCPDDPVTRGQMAVFLSKALGLYWAF